MHTPSHSCPIHTRRSLSRAFASIARVASSHPFPLLTPSVLPPCDGSYLTNPADLETLRKGLGIARSILAQEPFAHVLGPEVFPGASPHRRPWDRAPCPTG